MQFYRLYKPYLKEEPPPDYTGGFIKCTSPWPNDDSGSVDLVTGVFNSFKHGKLTATQFFKKVENKSPTEIRYALGNTSDVSSLEVAYAKCKPFGTLCETYCTLRGISISVGKAAGLKETTDCIVFPYTDIHGNLQGLKFRNAYTGEKNNKEGSDITLYNTYKDRETFSLVVFVEGESDTLRFKTELEEREITGVGVYGIPGDSIRREYLREVQYTNRIVVIPDTDNGGQNLIDSVKKVASKWHIVELPWKRGQKGKDFSDWIAYEDNDFNELFELINVNQGERIIMSDSELEETVPEEKNWIITNLLAKQEVALIGGSQKSRKTFLVFALVKAILEGKPLWGIPEYVGIPTTRILFIEEEGNKFDFKKRRDNVLGSDARYDNIFWLHASGLKLDTKEDMDWLIDYIQKNKIDLVILDPLQRFRDPESENSSSDVGPFWREVARAKRTTGVTLLVVHHFNQSGDVLSLWKSLRGSSRDAGEADLGIFNEKIEIPAMNKVAIDGREVHPNYPEGKTYFVLGFNSKTYDFTLTKPVHKKAEFYEVMMEREEPWELEECAKYFNCTTRTIKDRIEGNAKLSETFTYTMAAPGHPVKIIRR